MQGVNDSAKEIVLSYIRALDNRDYDLAKNYLSESVRVVGPAGEAFRNPSEFIEMLRKFSGRYDLKKVFQDKNDVCVLYDFVTSDSRVFMCSWYQVTDGKINSIQTIFDPRRFS